MNLKNRHIVGLLYGIGAYFLWGIFPIYWKLLSHVSPLEVLCHRIVWSAIFLFGLLYFKKQLKLKQYVQSKKSLLMFFIGGLLIGSNWFIYIWAIINNYTLETSLGYYICPLVSITLGMIFLKEKFSLTQWISIILAVAAVSILTIKYGRIPWIALSLALTFGFYGLVKKTSKFESLNSLWVETCVLFLPALIYLFTNSKAEYVVSNYPTILMLVGAGVVTSVPLLWFGHAARIVKLSTIGFLEYIAPTGQFLIAVFLFKEEFTVTHQIAFALIWLALIIFSFHEIKIKVKLAKNQDATEPM